MDADLTNALAEKLDEYAAISQGGAPYVFRTAAQTLRAAVGEVRHYGTRIEAASDECNRLEAAIAAERRRLDNVRTVVKVLLDLRIDQAVLDSFPGIARELGHVRDEVLAAFDQAGAPS